MKNIISARGLTKRFPSRRGLRTHWIHAVDDLNFSIGEGECVGLVGESGCGKTILSRLLSRMVEPTSGSILFDDIDLTELPMKKFSESVHRASIQIVFQDPTESLNPHFTAFQAVADPVRQLLSELTATEVEAKVLQAFDDVGLPRELGSRYPHQLSGGQKARIGIARAIAVEPRLLILDEPTSALDVSVQSTILRLLGELRAKRGMSYLFVTHDLEVVRIISDRILVMYLGKIIESGLTRQIFENPVHPYTRALLAASPDPARRGIKTARLEGSASSPIDPNPNACRFAGRCPVEIGQCRTVMPALAEIDGGHLAACHRAERLVVQPTRPPLPKSVVPISGIRS
ncbi:oligopeptide/dipeptide ABC transporter ATP-binding protein [Pararhizobium sp. DWP3-4]|uniref:oligopeptide/dipeptide ABC transporter ATP-binding protein n=1 Tax=Pararhizobium sp. DWP3-4 TaxID=2804565 RepID=UPI003CF878ED